MNLRYFTKCASTNRELMQHQHEIAAQDLPFGIWTGNQTAGRGQRGRHWDCPPRQALAASFLFAHKRLQVSEIYRLNKCVCEAVIVTLENCLPDDDRQLKPFSIKWPNDILYEGKKIAGILIENLLTGKLVARSVIGVGLNVNQASFPEGYRRQATSMREVFGRTYDLQAEVYTLAGFLEVVYNNMLCSPEKLDEWYKQRLYLREELHTFAVATSELKHTSVAGRIQDVDAQGRLVLATAEGLKYFSHGEIEWPL